MISETAGIADTLISNVLNTAQLIAETSVETQRNEESQERAQAVQNDQDSRLKNLILNQAARRKSLENRRSYITQLAVIFGYNEEEYLRDMEKIETDRQIVTKLEQVK